MVVVPFTQAVRHSRYSYFYQYGRELFVIYLELHYALTYVTLVPA